MTPPEYYFILQGVNHMPGLSTHSSKISRLLLFAACILMAAVSACTNFHAVTPDTLYRSRQLSAAQFSRFIKKHKIKTVINLRGASPGSPWYRDEIETMRKDSVFHIDIRLSAVRYVPPQKIDSIMDVASSAAKPILVHCQGGADRSGLFAAAWKLKMERSSVDKASKQLSFVYGHVPFFRNRTGAMDSSFRDYARYLDLIQNKN
jgi:protein tyrosine/serine phosphatase